jgi:hypothetical protein
VYLARSASCFRVSRSLSTRVCSEVEMDTEVALKCKIEAIKGRIEALVLAKGCKKGEKLSSSTPIYILGLGSQNAQSASMY